MSDSDADTGVRIDLEPSSDKALLLQRILVRCDDVIKAAEHTIMEADRERHAAFRELARLED